MRKVKGLPAGKDIHIDPGNGIRFGAVGDYWASFAPNQARALALTILSTWPDELDERDEGLVVMMRDELRRLLNGMNEFGKTRDVTADSRRIESLILRADEALGRVGRDGPQAMVNSLSRRLEIAEEQSARATKVLMEERDGRWEELELYKNRCLQLAKHVASAYSEAQLKSVIQQADEAHRVEKEVADQARRAEDDAKTLAVNLLMAELLDEIPVAQLVRIVQSIRNVVVDGEKLRPSKLPSYDALVSELTVMLFEGDEEEFGELRGSGQTDCEDCVGPAEDESFKDGVWVKGDGNSLVGSTHGDR